MNAMKIKYENRNFLLVFFSLFFLTSTAFSQKKYVVHFIFSGKDTSYEGYQLDLKTQFESRQNAATYINELARSLAVKGFAGASVDSMFYDSTGAMVSLHLGQKFKWLKIITDSADKKVLEKIGWNEKTFENRLINFSAIELEQKYLGIGPSAHSYNGQIRTWNRANNPLYIKSIQQNIIPFEKEILHESQKINEYVMTSIRTIEGLDLEFIESHFSKKERERIENILKEKVLQENYFIKNKKIILTDTGKLLADRIAVELFL